MWWALRCRIAGNVNDKGTLTTGRKVVRQEQRSSQRSLGRKHLDGIPCQGSNQSYKSFEKWNYIGHKIGRDGHCQSQAKPTSGRMGITPPWCGGGIAPSNKELIQRCAQCLAVDGVADSHMKPKQQTCQATAPSFRDRVKQERRWI